MIVSFGDRATEDLYHGRSTGRARRFPNDIVNVALVKLDMLESAATVLDLKSPPGNRLEALRGGLRGFHSIRVNDRWRIVFRWENNGARDVRLMDYHS
ncbi:MAG: type II toxin-antitoxin system RelE/ParE family toxin [Coriobacteriia bacterium]